MLRSGGCSGEEEREDDLRVFFLDVPMAGWKGIRHVTRVDAPLRCGDAFSSRDVLGSKEAGPLVAGVPARSIAKGYLSKKLEVLS